jgi:hypothetical protein
MNRRSFLKASAALIAAPAVPALPSVRTPVLFIDELYQSSPFIQNIVAGNLAADIAWVPAGLGKSAVVRHICNRLGHSYEELSLESDH